MPQAGSVTVRGIVTQFNTIQPLKDARIKLTPGVIPRIRDVLTGPDGSIYLATSNRDGHFLPEGDDKILRITPRP